MPLETGRGSRDGLLTPHLPGFWGEPRTVKQSAP
jgi:hypothetical protein